MDDDVKNMFFKLLQENRHKLASLLAEEDSESDTASVMSVSRTSQYGDGASKYDDLSSDLKRELECPVCMEMMKPPIRMCKNGHNICSNCKSKFKKCPTCNNSFLKVRNVALEKFVKKMEGELPCCYASNGCKRLFTPEELKEHEILCFYRLYGCPLSNAERINCSWNDAYIKLKDHIASVHRDRLTISDTEKKVIMRQYIPTRKYSRIIFAWGEIFYQQFQVIDDIFYFIIQHVGPETCAVKYRYSFSLALRNNIETIFIAFIARSKHVDINDIYRSGQCVKLHYDTVKNFMEENNTLAFSFCITQANSRN